MPTKKIKRDQNGNYVFDSNGNFVFEIVNEEVDKLKENQDDYVTFITPDEIKEANYSEEKLSDLISKKSVIYGIDTDESMDFFDGVKFRKIPESAMFGESASQAYQYVTGDVSDTFYFEKDKEKETAKQINDYLNNVKDINYVETAKLTSGKVFNEYKNLLSTIDISDEDVKQAYKDKQKELYIQNIDSRTQKIGVGGVFNPAPKVSSLDQELFNVNFGNSIEEFDELNSEEIDENKLLIFKKQYLNQLKDETGTKIRRKYNYIDAKKIDALVKNEALEFEEKSKKLNELATNFNKDYNTYIKELQEYKKSPNPSSLIELDKKHQDLLNRKIEITNLYEYAEETQKYLPNAIRDFGASFNYAENISTSFKTLGLDIVTSVVDLISYPFPEKYRKAFLEPLYDTKEEFRIEADGYAIPLKFEQVNSISDAASWAVGSLVQQVPSVSMAFTRKAALPLFFASGYGSKAQEIALNERNASIRLLNNTQLLNNPNISLEETIKIQNEIDEDKKILGVNPFKKFSVKMAHGLAEVTFEKLGTLTNLAILRKNLKNLPSANVKEASKKLLKAVPAAFTREGLSEFATTYVQNMSDVYLLNEDKNVFDNTLESFAQGGLMGSVFGLAGTIPGVRRSIVSEIQTRKEKKEFDNILNEASRILGVKIDHLDNETVKKTTDKELKPIIQELVDKYNLHDQKVFEKLVSGKITLEQAIELGDINRKIRKLDDQYYRAASTAENTDLDAINKFYENKYFELLEERESLFGTDQQQLENEQKQLDDQFNMQAKEGYRIIEKRINQPLKLQLQQEFNLLSSDAKKQYINKAAKIIKDQDKISTEDALDIKKQAMQIYVEEKTLETIDQKNKIATNRANKKHSKTLNILDVKDESGKDEMIQLHRDYVDAKVANEQITKQEANQEHKEFVKNINEGKADGKYLEIVEGFNDNKATAIHYRLNSAPIGKTSTLSHEILHHEVTLKYGGDKAAIEEGKKLFNFLEKNEPNLYLRVKSILDKSYGVDNNAYFLETFNVLSDVLSNMKEAVNKKALMGYLKNFLNNKFKVFNFLKKDEEIFNFVVEYSKYSYHKGRGFKLIQSLLESTDDPEKEIKPVDRATTEKKYSKIFKDNVKRKFNNLSEGDALPARDVWPFESNERKGRLAIEIAGLYEGTLVNALRSGQAQILRREGLFEDFKEDAKTNLSIHILNFNPEKNDDVHGWINSQVANKAQDAIKGLGIQLETLPLGETEKQIPQQPEETTIQQRQVEEEALQKQTLKQKISIDDKSTTISEIKDILDKIISDFNIGARDVESTTRVSDFVAILKERIQGKKPGTAFKLLRRKFRVGNSTRNEYRENLIKNKKAILEGLTTSYLSRAFPPAIEKRIINEDGSTKFVKSEEWLKIPKKNIGKKPGFIDIRGTKEEGFEGDTTGKQAMRRVENIAEAVSDEVFLAKYIVDNKVPQMPSEMLMQQLAGEIGLDIFQEEINKFDEFNEALNKAEGNDKLINEIKNSDKYKTISSFIDNQAALANVIKRSTISNISMQLERGVTKYSSLQGLDDSQLEEAIRFTEDFITYKSSPEKQESINFENELNNYLEEIAPYLSDYYKEVLVPIEELLNDTTQRNRTANAKEITASKIIDASLDKLNKKRKEQGLAEIRIDKIPALGSSRKGDFKIKVGKIIKLIEYKSKYSDLMGSVTFVYNKDNGTFTMNIPKGKKAEITKKIIKEKNLTVKTREGKIKLKTTYSSLTSSQKKIFDEEMKKEYDEWKSNNTALVEKLEKLLSSKEIIGVNGVIDKYEKALSNLKVDITKRRKNGSVVVNRDQRKKVQDDKNVPKTYTFERIEGLTMDDSISLYAEQNNDLMVISPQLYTFATSLEASNRTGVPQLQAKKGNKIFSPGMDGIFHIIGSANSIAFRVSFQITKNDLQYIIRPKSKISNVEIIESLVNEKPPKYSILPQDLDLRFNEIIQETKGVNAKAVFSDTLAALRGAQMNKYKFFVPPSADDFMGLMYGFMGRGSVGDVHKDFFEEALNAPYKRGIAALESAKQKMQDDYIALKKAYPDVAKKLGKKIPGKEFTYDQAIRVYLWKFNKEAFDVDLQDSLGLSGDEINELFFTVADNKRIQQFARGLGKLTNLPEGYIRPSNTWIVGNIENDLNELSDKVSRKKYLAQFIENKEAIFSKENLNKIESIYGTSYRSAIEDSLFAMINGTSRNFGQNEIANRFTNYLNGSVGAIMFFNMRSAALQLTSTINYVNWSDNNILQAGKAFANQKQFWKDFETIIMSDKLRQRRKGLTTDVQAAELASSVADASNKYKAVLRYLLKKGFFATQAADALAISFGGASFYRNRANTYIERDGLTKEEAEKKAFEDFSQLTDASQQSADAAMISQQQRNPLIRFALVFQNTAMQYNRLIKKAGLDLINRRGSDRENISKIIYYGAIQNFIFNAVQQAMFAMIWGSDESEEKEMERYYKVANSMFDTILRGSGWQGALLSTLKNTVLRYRKEEEKGSFKADHFNTAITFLNLSPSIGSKFSKVYGAYKTNYYERDVIKEKGYSWDSPIWSVYGKLVSAALNIPADRAFSKINNLRIMSQSHTETWQKVALFSGWPAWQLNIEDKEHELIKIEGAKTRKLEGIEKAKVTRAKTNKIKSDLLKSEVKFLEEQTKNMSEAEEEKYLIQYYKNKKLTKSKNK